MKNKTIATLFKKQDNHRDKENVENIEICVYSFASHKGFYPKKIEK